MEGRGNVRYVTMTWTAVISCRATVMVLVLHTVACWTHKLLHLNDRLNRCRYI